MFYEQIKGENRQPSSILCESCAKYEEFVNEEQANIKLEDAVKAEGGKTVYGKLWSFVVLYMAVFVIPTTVCLCLLGVLFAYLIYFYLIHEAKKQ